MYVIVSEIFTVTHLMLLSSRGVMFAKNLKWRMKAGDSGIRSDNMIFVNSFFNINSTTVMQWNESFVDKLLKTGLSLKTVRVVNCSIPSLRK